MQSHAGAVSAGERLASHSYPVRRTALSLAIAVALGLPAVGFAQDAAPAPEGELEEVVVTGIRAGIESAIAVKADSGSIVEAISAEDIGKLPDTSIAESIARLPGLTSQRAEGRASAISLRGTDPGFTTALLNGREQVSTGDNRSVEFDQYPSELINQVVVYKTPDSALVGQGLAGTIDLRTIRPLDYGKQAIVLNLRGEKNSNDNLGADSDDTGWRASFSYVDQFMDGKLGLAFGYAHLDSPLATRGFGTYEPWNASGGPGTTDCGGVPNGCVTNPGVAAGNYVTGGMKVRADMGSTERDGLMAAVQFEPNDFYTGIIDLYWSTMDQTNNARSLEVNTGCYPATCFSGDVGSFPLGTIFGYSDTTVRNDTIVAGTLNTVLPLVRNFLFTTEDEILATGWRNEFALTDEWSLVADISYSKATRDQLQPEVNAQYVTNPSGPPFNQYDTGTFRLRGTSGMPSLSFLRDYADPTQVLVGPTVYGSGYTKKPRTEDDLTSFRVDAIRSADMWWFDEVSFGANYSDRSKEKESPETALSTGNVAYQIDPQFVLRPMNLNYADAGKAMAINVNGVLREYFDPIVFGRPVVGTDQFAYLVGKFWTVDEKVTTAYLRGDLSHDLSDSVRLRGNVGVQVIYTDQSSSSFRVNTGAGNTIYAIEDGKTYTDVLPQLNFAFELPDDQAVRVGLSRQMARPRMDQLKATEESGFNFATGEPGGSGGNARLDPWRANALDLSYEKFFADRKGYVSAATFYKDLRSYIYTQTTDGYDFSELCATTPDDAFPPGVVKQCTGRFSRPVNNEGGYLFGLEFALSVPFSMFSDALDGFGAIVSYAYTDSDIEIQGSISSVANENIPLPGLSEDVWNATLYYEKYGFGARIATRYRSEYIGEVSNFANERALRFVDSDMITDAQVSYLFSEGMLDGLQLLFQINNLTNEPYVAYSEDKQRLLDYQEYGTQYLLGVNYRF